jgi:hypothetical protein
MKNENLYVCKVPLIADHIYSEPHNKRKVDETYGSWWVVSKNKRKNIIILAQSQNQNQRIRMPLELFEKHFKKESNL